MTFNYDLRILTESSNYSSLLLFRYYYLLLEPYCFKRFTYSQQEGKLIDNRLSNKTDPNSATLIDKCQDLCLETEKCGKTGDRFRCYCEFGKIFYI